MTPWTAFSFVVENDKAHMNYDYPLLNKVFAFYKDKKHLIPDVFLVCCQHLLEPQLKMFDLLIDFGFTPQKIFVLGKAYSTNKSVFSEIENRGIKVIQPSFSGISFDEEHKNNCKKVLDTIPADAKTILLDDGAELIKTFANAQRQVIFAVEQTSSGFRKLENSELSFPVINVARSATKLVQESPLIARLCFERIKDYLANKNITNPSVIVVGLGPIGEAIFEIFKQNRFVVQGFDIKDGHSNLSAFIDNTKTNVVIGATGFSVLKRDEVETLVSDNPVYLISVSSSDREFPVASFRNGSEIHNDVSYKNITFVNNGFPITFKGNRYELTPVEIEKTICLLGGAVIDGVVNPINKVGLVNISPVLEKIIN